MEARKVSKEKVLEDAPAGFRKQVEKALASLDTETGLLDEGNPKSSGLRVSCDGKLYLVKMVNKMIGGRLGIAGQQNSLLGQQK